LTKASAQTRPEAPISRALKTKDQGLRTKD
jgi:hypothetical protein